MCDKSQNWEPFFGRADQSNDQSEEGRISSHKFTLVADKTKMKVVITGASGLLGRQVFAEFSSLPSCSVVGLGFSRASPNITKLDLTDEAATAALLNELKPNVVIHSAAQRFPDKVEKDFEAARELNVTVSRRLAALCSKLNARLIYISTDYVFDGTAAPYSHLAVPKPANKYGETKLAGELAVLEEDSSSLCLRVPVLYGPVQDLKESALTVLLDVLKNSNSPATLSSYEVRCPAHTGDIAKILVDMVKKLDNLEGGVYQWSGRWLPRSEIGALIFFWATSY